MLTATYTLVAVSAEQKTTRTLLSRLKQYISDSLMRLQELDVSNIEAVLNKLTQFDRYCHTRKIETCLIPAVRGTAREVDALVAELESMSARAVELLNHAREKLQQAAGESAERIRELFGAMATYCDKLLTRLAREENELLPLLGKTLSVDAWFSIGAKFLSADDARRRRAHTLQQVPAP